LAEFNDDHVCFFLSFLNISISIPARQGS